MSSRLVNMILGLFVVLFFVFAGCSQQQSKSPRELEIAMPDDRTVSDYAREAMGATGGLAAWAKTKVIDVDSIVIFYQPDKSYYLTRQSYKVYPWTNSIEVSGDEPSGRFVWPLSNGIFSVLEGNSRLPTAISGRDFTELILYIITAPARFSDGNARFSKSVHPVKLKGLWYEPIEREKVFNGALPYWDKVVFYQNRDAVRVDIIWFKGAGKDKFFAVRGYDYDEIVEDGVLVPHKIEIFRATAVGDLGERLVKIDLK